MSDIHPTACIEAGAIIGSGSRIWRWSHVAASARIGERCVLGQNVAVGPNVVIGHGVKLQNNVSVYEGVEIEDEVFCGPSAVFTNVLNPRAFVERKTEFKPTRVKRGATLGANCTIVCGVTLGEYCMIGAGAVVTRDVPAHALLLGNPGRIAGWVSRSGETLKFDEDGVARCPRDGERYRLEDDRLQVLEP